MKDTKQVNYVSHLSKRMLDCKGLKGHPYPSSLPGSLEAADGISRSRP